MGFGVPASSDPHHFKVIIPKANNGQVIISEYLGLQAQRDEYAVVDRVMLERPRWTCIQPEVQRTFNSRLKEHGVKTSSWKIGENVVDRLLGKELCVLAWAVERMELENIPIAVRNWLALRPEERWWLFGMNAMSTGGIEDGNKGWRIALRHALGDIAQSDYLKCDLVSSCSSSVSLKSSDINTSPKNLINSPAQIATKASSSSDKNSLPQVVANSLPSNELNRESSNSVDSTFWFEAKKAKAEGYTVGVMSKPEFIVKKSSTANIAQANSQRPAISELRQKLLDEGVLLKEGDIYIFTRDYRFSSPSTAACLIAGNPRSGLDAWRDVDGRTLKKLGYGKKC
ncbi:anti-phage-associated DUF3780 domain-containing protein [Legionella pneumophila]